MSSAQQEALDNDAHQEPSDGYAGRLDPLDDWEEVVGRDVVDRKAIERFRAAMAEIGGSAVAAEEPEEDVAEIREFAVAAEDSEEDVAEISESAVTGHSYSTVVRGPDGFFVTGDPVVVDPPFVDTDDFQTKMAKVRARLPETLEMSEG